MKVVLFCGGRGIRLREPSEAIPKPMVTDRLPADPVARHALLRPLRPPRLHPLPRLPRPTRSRTTSCTTRRRCPTTSCCPTAAARSSCSARHRRLADHLRRHRARHDDRRAAAPGAPPSRGRGAVPGQLRRHAHRRTARPHRGGGSGRATPWRRCCASVRPIRSTSCEPDGDGRVAAIRDTGRPGLRINGGGYVLRPGSSTAWSSGEDLVDYAVRALGGGGPSARSTVRRLLGVARHAQGSRSCSRRWRSVTPRRGRCGAAARQ